MYDICKILINANKTQGLKEKMGTLMLVGLLTQEQFTELCGIIKE